MIPRRPLAIAAGAAAFCLAVAILTILFIPNREIKGVVARLLEREGYRLEKGDFGKAFPLGLTAHGIVIGSDKGSLVRIDSARLRVQLLPLLTGTAAVGYTVRIGEGTVSGAFSQGRKNRFDLQASGVRLQDIPFFTSVAGAEVKGTLKANATFQWQKGPGTGEVKAEVSQADLRSIRISGMPLPDAGFETVQGKLVISGGRATLESLTLQGKGLYVRLRGDATLLSPVQNSPINLTLEMMPKPEFLEQQKLVFLLLTKYLGSPGYYQIPIRGVLGKPAL